MVQEEQVVVPDMLGLVEDPTTYAELKSFKPPTEHQLRIQRAIACTQSWAYRKQKEGVLYGSEIEAHLMSHHSLAPDRASDLIKDILPGLARKGVPIN